MMEQEKESTFNPFVWAHFLHQEEFEYGRRAYNYVRFYAIFHNWSKEFTEAVTNELKLLKEKEI